MRERGRLWPYLLVAAALVAAVTALLLAEDTSGLYDIRR